MASNQEIIERALKYISNPDWEYHECLIMLLAMELAPKYNPSPKDNPSPKEDL